MKLNSPANVGFRRVLFACVILVSCTFSSAYCQSHEITLLVQQTPSNAGQVTPGEGTYKYAPNSEVIITATPNEGYEFLYWLGDVSDQDSITTTVRLDKPKIVVAVFEPIKTGLNGSKKLLPTIGGGGSSGGGSLMGNRARYGNSISINDSGGGVRPQESIPVYIPLPAGENAPAIPEPATGLLLALGSLFTFTKRRSGKANPSRK